MKTLKLTLLVTYLTFITFLLTGCGATMVQTRGKVASTYAPVNENKTRGGTVSYNNTAFQNIRRENAYEKMHDYCGGDYRIVNEYSKAEVFGSTNYYDGSYMESTINFEYIDFECVN